MSAQYGQIDMAWALAHFHRQQYNVGRMKGLRHSTEPFSFHVQGWVHGKQISSPSEIIPAGRWLIHYIPHKETVETYPAVKYAECILLIDNCGQPYEVRRDLRTCTIPVYTITCTHQTILKDPRPLPNEMIDLYKTVATPCLPQLLQFTQMLYTLAGQRAEETNELVRLRATVAAAKEEEIRLRAALAQREADLMALI